MEESDSDRTGAVRTADRSHHLHQHLPDLHHRRSSAGPGGRRRPGGGGAVIRVLPLVRRADRSHARVQARLVQGCRLRRARRFALSARLFWTLLHPGIRGWHRHRWHLRTRDPRAESESGADARSGWR